MRLLLSIILLISITSCIKSKHADLVIHNAIIYTCDETFSVVQAVAIKDGKIVETGPDREIMNKYRADKFVDMQKKVILPGFVDAHGHLHSLAMKWLIPDLSEAKSKNEVVKILQAFYRDKDKNWISGKGWDQAKWNMKDLPDNSFLNEAFPDKPVFIKRIDGHAALINEKAIQILNINTDTTIAGGTLVKKDGKFTGLLIDKAMNLIPDDIYENSEDEWFNALDEAQNHLLSFGITTIADAGLSHKDLLRMIKYNNEGKLKIFTYAMLYPEKKNLDWIELNGHYENANLVIRSFKVLSDGALGSRGACMLHPYSDAPHHGKMLQSSESFRDIAHLADVLDYQLNVHCIGDSANRVILDIMGEVLQGQNDKRWRIEHAQVVSASDLEKFALFSIIPSVQPSHMMSDYQWLKDRIGEERMKNGYRCLSLKNANGMIAFGTDFPVESANPMRTFYAAFVRKTEQGLPASGFFPEEKLSREETLTAMTRWAALSIFSENTKGSIQAGKDADFIVIQKNLMEIDESEILKTHVLETYIKGERVYSGL